jgi:Ca2+-transporting ATPase
MSPAEPAGLTNQQATERLTRDGPNDIGVARRPSSFGIALALVREPMTLLLLGCGAIYLVLGDRQESLMLLGFVVFIMGITLFQEQKTERALEALRDMASPRALVVRDGERVRIAGRDVVVGDLLVLAEGDRVPADATLLACPHLTVDESLLTGESMPVHKTALEGGAAASAPDGRAPGAGAPVARPGGDGLPFVYAGTLVVEGGAIGRVHATGPRTEMGRIGRALAVERDTPTSLERETRRLVRRLAWIGAGLSAVAFLAFGASRGNWLDGLLAGLTLAMAILPNEIPVIITIFLALGAWRLSQRRVLTRRIPAIEAIGSATVLCVDKTGTLTENRMTVDRIASCAPGDAAGAGGARELFAVERLAREPLPEAFHEVVEYSILASRRDPFDPMERAFKELGERHLAGTEHMHPDWTLVREYPLSRELLAVTQAWRAPGMRGLVVATKGAPEAVADLCHADEAMLRAMRRDVERLAAEGLRVLAVARGTTAGEAPPERAHDCDFELLGLVGLADPVRSEVPAAVAECHSAGIRVVMITGDYPATATAVGRRLGIAPSDVFARVLPEQKLRIIEELRARGEVVAMTGDGVNDAPALRAADIGVAMGGRGTDVAREASRLVLLDDSFTSLVEAVRGGRRIIDNLRKALAYVLAVHVPIVGLTLVPIFAGWPLVLLPIHVAFLHLVIDPACSVVFETEAAAADVMRRPPRDPRAPLFGKRMLALSVAQGLVVMVAVLTLYGFVLRAGVGDAPARALTFTAFMVANVALIFANGARNRSLLWLLGGVAVFLGLVLSVPRLGTLFQFGAVRPAQLAAAVAAGLASGMWSELARALGAILRRTGGRAAQTPGRQES